MRIIQAIENCPIYFLVTMTMSICNKANERAYNAAHIFAIHRLYKDSGMLHYPL